MQNKRILWLFPLATQGIFSLFLPFFSAFDLSGLGYVALLATLPAFIFALICYRKRLHQRNILQIAIFSGVLMFFYTLLLFSAYLAFTPPEELVSIWEHTLAVIFYALMFALPAMMYSLVFLRLFLEKKTIKAN